MFFFARPPAQLWQALSVTFDVDVLGEPQHTQSPCLPQCILLCLISTISTHRWPINWPCHHSTQINNTKNYLFMPVFSLCSNIPCLAAQYNHSLAHYLSWSSKQAAILSFDPGKNGEKSNFPICSAITPCWIPVESTSFLAIPSSIAYWPPKISAEWAHSRQIMV